MDGIPSRDTKGELDEVEKWFDKWEIMEINKGHVSGRVGMEVTRCLAGVVTDEEYREARKNLILQSGDGGNIQGVDAELKARLLTIGMMTVVNEMDLQRYFQKFEGVKA